MPFCLLSCPHPRPALFSPQSPLSRSGLLFLCLKPSVPPPAPLPPPCLQEQPQPLGALSKLALAGFSVLRLLPTLLWGPLPPPARWLRLLQSLAALFSCLCSGSSLEFPLSLSSPRILEISEEHLQKQSHGNKCVSKKGGQLRFGLIPIHSKAFPLQLE